VHRRRPHEPELLLLRIPLAAFAALATIFAALASLATAVVLARAVVERFRLPGGVVG